MKRVTKFFSVLLFLSGSVGLFAQSFYDQEWKKISDNYQKGVVKSNLPIILEIEKQAMKDNNVLELIRALKGEFAIVNQTRDDTQNNSASQFFSKIEKAQKDLKGEENLVFQVFKVKFVQDYWQQNQWRIQGRTNIDSQDLTQIETWSKLDFKKYLAKSYADLDRDGATLERVSLSKYAKLFEDSKDIAYFPNVSDWLALQKIDFLENTGLFTPNEITTNRTEIAKIYNDEISANTGNPKLFFQYQQAMSDVRNNNLKSQDAVKKYSAIAESNTDGDYKVLIMNDIAASLADSERLQALSWINKAKAIYPKSLFQNNIKNTEAEITRATISVKYEQITLPQQPIHLSVNYNNADGFNLNVYQVTDINSFIKSLQDEYKNPWGKVSKKLVTKKEFALKNPNDYKNHISSVALDGLPNGIYIAEYLVNGAVVDTYWFAASNSRLIYKNIETSHIKNIVKLVDRDNGNPFGQTKLQVFNYSDYENKTVTPIAVSTNANGEFSIPQQLLNSYRQILIYEPSTQNINFFNTNGEGRDYAKKDNDIETVAQIFLDRAIYRPGQTVYFKVINIKGNDKSQSVAAGIQQKITLTDANGKEVSSLTFKTNEFGSYWGNFVLPKGVLNGMFSLETDDDNDSEKRFSVEEYKRPNFEVIFEPLKDEYKFGQTIAIKGKATSFSGVPISNATINYEIKKQDIRYRYFSWYPRTSNQNSILGTAQTNDKGEFTIPVELKKDEKMEGPQVNQYSLNASLTDVNGETQNGQTDFRVASVSHYIDVQGEAKSFTDEDVQLKVTPKNYNDQKLNKSYQMKLSKMETSDRVMRNNFIHNIQNLPLFAKAEFIQKFPHDYFDSSELPENRKVAQVVNQKTMSDENVNLGKLPAGDYKVEFYNIEGQDTIKTQKTFTIWDKRNLDSAQKPFLAVVQGQKDYARGEKAKLYIYSAIPNAKANVYTQFGDNKTEFSQKEIKNGLLVYEVAIPTDKTISKVNVQVLLPAYNDVVFANQDLLIRKETQQMTMELTTFRDKIQPGSKEKWTVKVLGKNKDKINAEVLANMYDMSLDQFAANNYNFTGLLYDSFNMQYYSMPRTGLRNVNYYSKYKYLPGAYVNIPNFTWFGGVLLGGVVPGLKSSGAPGVVVRDMVPEPSPAPMAMAKVDSVKTKGIEEVVVVAFGTQKKSVAVSGSIDFNRENKALGYASDADGIIDKKDDLSSVPVRNNLNETAFFYPNLVTDKDGNVNFEFTSPEALTKWKLMFLAHDKQANSATLEQTIVTQKDFSVTPNYPRFLREGDEIVIQSKLNNLVDKTLQGSAQLQILDAQSNADISNLFGLNNSNQSFNLAGNSSQSVSWKLKAPKNVSAIIIKVVAKAGAYSDGEQKAIPILPNRMLVTDATPIFVKEGQTKTFVIDNLKNATSSSIQNFSNTLELTTNPIWEILFALPSIKEDTDNSADVVFNKWFADVLASEVFKANPRMKTVFDEYQSKGLLKSNLEQNQELKQLLLEETPWVLESANEGEQMQRLARLFDANNMRNSTQGDWTTLTKLQNNDGGFSWYQGSPSSLSTSLYILKNLGKINEWLAKDKSIADYQSTPQDEMVSKLIAYVDREINNYWKPKDVNPWSNSVLDYLDSRHYWETKYPLKNVGATLKTQIIAKAKVAKMTDFTFFGLSRVALLFNDYGLKDVSNKLMTYLKETSTDTQTQGVYWKQNLNDWGWYSSKTINQALALQAFNKLKPNDPIIEEMKIWLITQKEVNHWNTSRATAEVIYTIINSGKSWTSTDADKANIVWGGKALSNPDQQATGYVKSTIKTDKLDKALAEVTVTKPGAGIVQGGVYWQYYEDLDKIKSSESYISITKELYKKVKTENGEELQKIAANTPLKVGDKVTVRMILNTDRNMEFVHIKDMRAAGFEPVDVISQYQWKNNLGYYQSTKDASTNFYIQYMPKGKYVFEYDFVANAAGSFSNGITTMQNYYAPQMNAHTSGGSVVIEPQK